MCQREQTFLDKYTFRTPFVPLALNWDGVSKSLLVLYAPEVRWKFLSSLLG